MAAYRVKFANRTCIDVEADSPGGARAIAQDVRAAELKAKGVSHRLPRRANYLPEFYTSPIVIKGVELREAPDGR